MYGKFYAYAIVLNHCVTVICVQCIGLLLCNYNTSKVTEYTLHKVSYEMGSLTTAAFLAAYLLYTGKYTDHNTVMVTISTLVSTICDVRYVHGLHW